MTDVSNDEVASKAPSGEYSQCETTWWCPTNLIYFGSSANVHMKT